MTGSPEQSATRADVVERVAQAYTASGGEDPDFVERFYHLVATEELLARTAETLAGAARSQQQLAEHRAPGTAKVAVFNPTTDEHGWTNPRTIVQIVTDDMPFLVDSVTQAIVGRDLDIHLVVHPQFMVTRDDDGRLESVEPIDPNAPRQPPGGPVPESWMMLTIERIGESRRSELTATIEKVLADVRHAVDDWPKMRTKCLVIAAELEGTPPVCADPQEIERGVQFLRWMADNHFTFLGYREYTLSQTDAGEVIEPIRGTGLGLLREDPPADRAPTVLTEAASRRAHDANLLVLTKANSISTVHRSVYLDYVSVKTYDEQGVCVGERRFLGLYAYSAYTDSVTRIPLVADKVAAVIERAGVTPDSHTGKDLLGILESYPRDELFQSTLDELYRTAFGATQLQARRRTALFVREDAFGRFASCLVYIPRDRYNTTVRVKMADLLKDAFGGESVEFSARVSDSALARLQFVVRMPRGDRLRTLGPEQIGALEERLVEVSRTWSDRLGVALREARGEVEGDRLMDRFGGGFPVPYEEVFSVQQGVADLKHLDRLGDERRTSVALYRPAGEDGDIRRFKLFRVNSLSLTDILPIFTDMGVEVVDEHPYELTRDDGTTLHVYDFGLRATSAEVWDAVPHSRMRDLFESVVLAVWDGRAESDGFNRLVLGAHLTWRQVVWLRTVAKYLRQARTAFSQSYLEDALVSNPGIARALVELFETRFDPTRRDGAAGDERAAEEEGVAQRIIDGLDDVSSLDHDRIIRAFLGVIRATLRTNAFQVDDAGEPKAYVSLKIDPKKVPDLPAPRPMFEIWVYSPRVEGVHLRFGPVARGGLRWSDRREDFRTEVLGLVKAQMVKNAVIVPTGSKGGFYAKQLPDPAEDRDAWMEEGRAAYRLFISGMLDITDNRVVGDIVAPPDVVRHDPDDPYLVVAADKGTATFSDIANGVAQSYGFWLDDAFASGGSAGYDHKGMGITARGAWESVKRHFREMGHDTQTEDFTVVGVGDMSGDVFGNGMLLSEHIRLVAAFDHRHVFIDPAPDAATSYAERRRLFDLPRSSWDDYDKSLISEGGGVFARTLKSISITPQMVEALGLPEGTTAMTPSELIHAALLAPVDLLWNGGIGTYVKASTEDNVSIGDRANDAIRVDGDQLRVKVLGEGGNLGASQLGRIEAAFSGVRINTDAIDNSAGVDTSDHEVNIKILLGEVVRRDELTLEERNELLVSMTDDVAEHVLRDNYEQNVLLGNARAQERVMVPAHERLMKWLEEHSDLDRQLEFLPSDAEVEKRYHEGEGLKSPEFSVLVAYSKLALKRDLLASDLPDDPYVERMLVNYFPPALQERYRDDIEQHPLRREIITNSIANSMINRGGITFAFRAAEETGATADQVARAYVVAREVFDLADFVRCVEELDNVVPTATQTVLYLEFRRLLDRAVRWFLAARTGRLDIAAEIDRFKPVVARLAPHVPEMQRGTERERLEADAARLEPEGVPRELALRSAALLDCYSLLDIADIATDLERTPEDVAAVYYLASEEFGIDDLLTKVSKLPREDRWDALARSALRDDLYAVLEAMTRGILEAGDGTGDAGEQFGAWEVENQDAITRSQTALRGILRLDTPNVAALSVALRTLRSVVRGT